MPAIRPRTEVGARVRTTNHGEPVEGTLRNKGTSGDLWLIQLDDGECFWAGTETVDVVDPDRERAERLEAAALADYFEGQIP